MAPIRELTSPVTLAILTLIGPESPLAADFLERDRLGWETYGKAMAPGDGRDCIRNAYEELLDAVQYLIQRVLEGDAARLRDALDCLEIAGRLRNSLLKVHRRGRSGFER